MTRTVYRIRDLYGDVVAEHVRVELPGGKKRFEWRLPGCDAHDGLMGLSVSDLPLYGAETIGRIPVGETVLLVEGEKTRDRLLAVYPYVLATVTGSSTAPGEDALSPLLANDVVTWEDHQDGEKHMRRVAGTLLHLGGSVRRLVWAGAREKGDDGADWLDRGGTRLGLDLMLAAAEPWTVAPEERPAVRLAYARQDDGGRVETAKATLLRVVEERLGPPHEVRQGTPWWRCPFHGEKSPSFKVDTREPFFRCFGCGARGDVFTFLRDLDGVGFADAIRELAPAAELGGIPRLGA